MTNKMYRSLSIAIILIFLTSASFSAQGFEPEEYGVDNVTFYLLQDKSDAFLNDHVNITYVIHSFTNYTMRNVTLTQEIPSEVKIIYSQFSETILNETESVNVTGASFDLTLDGSIDTAISDQYFLNQSYLSVHFPIMTNKTKASFWIMVNCTSSGSPVFDEAEIKWQDVYTDFRTVTAAVISFDIEDEEDIDERLEYLDGYENEKEGADELVLAGLIGIPLIAIFLTPFLYRKR